jgi:hypothetical protein
MAEHVDLTEAHGIEKVDDGGGMLGDARARGRRIRFPETRHIRGKNRAVFPGDREKSLENSPGVGDCVEAEKGRTLLEAAAGRNGVMNVQLTIAALEVTAAEPRSRCHRGARM